MSTHPSSWPASLTSVPRHTKLIPAFTSVTAIPTPDVLCPRVKGHFSGKSSLTTGFNPHPDQLLRSIYFCLKVSFFCVSLQLECKLCESRNPAWFPWPRRGSRLVQREQRNRSGSRPGRGGGGVTLPGHPGGSLQARLSAPSSSGWTPCPASPAAMVTAFPAYSDFCSPTVHCLLIHNTAVFQMDADGGQKAQWKRQVGSSKSQVLLSLSFSLNFPFLVHRV